jgi:hypothetical protein
MTVLIADNRSAIELLLESDLFRPTRTVVLAFGIDEETGGKVVRLSTPFHAGASPIEDECADTTYRELST